MNPEIQRVSRNGSRIAAAALVMALAVVPAAAADLWLHVRVEERGEKPETVRVNLPLSLIESVAPILHETLKEHGEIKIGDKDWDGARLREVWKAVRSAADGQYVTVESEGESVRVAKKGDRLTVRASQSGESSETVDVKVPLAVVDALLSGPSDSLNFVAAIEALKASGAGELVTVTDGASHVRIWIDATGNEE